MILLLVAAALLVGGCRSSSPEQARERGFAYLRQAQDEDGAWRSTRYTDMASGAELTPYVLKALMFGDGGGGGAALRGVGYLEQLDPQGHLVYPVYTSAGVLMTVGDRPAWKERLLGLQLTEARGWAAEDPQHGGWGYFMAGPPVKTEPLPPLLDSNLPATLFAVGALRLTGTPANDPVLQQALAFVKRCQNVPGDGGFFTSPADPTMNKAGPGVSYGSATSDGLRCLLACGLPPEDERVQAAAGWVRKHLNTQQNPGEFPEGRLYDRDSLYYYYLWSTAHALAALRRAGAAAPEDDRWFAEAGARLVQLQKPDGSWVNTAEASREDEPLVATSFALAVLSLAP